MSGGDCNRTHQNSHCLQWSKSWARDIQWPCRWSQLYCHPDLFSDFMSLTERSLLQPCSCIKHREIFSCMCSVCKKSRNLPKCGAKDWGSCRVCHWPYKHSASHAVDDVSTGPKRGQAQSDIIWYGQNKLTKSNWQCHPCNRYPIARSGQICPNHQICHGSKLPCWGPDLWHVFGRILRLYLGSTRLWVSDWAQIRAPVR